MAKTPTNDPPRCPRCKEETLITINGFTAYCEVCSKSWALPKAPKS